MYQPGDTSTADYIPCSTTNCRNESWAYDDIYNATLPYYEYYCVYESLPRKFSESTLFHAFVYTMYSVIFVFALFGNTLVCIMIKKTPHMKTVTNYFIANLAVGDILMTVLCIPFSFVPMLILKYWPFGGIMCKIVNYSQAVSVFVSSYTLLAISIDRYQAIIHPLKPRLEKKTALIVVATVWCGAVFTAVPIPIVSQLHKLSLWHKVCKVNICIEHWSDAKQSHQYTTALLILQFLLPLGVLVFTYARIAYVVWSLRPPGEPQSIRDLRLQTSKRKMVKMMVTVVTVFTICWLPLNIFIKRSKFREIANNCAQYSKVLSAVISFGYSILWDAHSEDDNWASWPGMPYVWFACHWLAMSHTCYNPIIYGYMNSRYRRGFKLVFQNILRTRVVKEQGKHICRRTSVCDGIPLSEIDNVGIGKCKSASTGQLTFGKYARSSSLKDKASKTSISLARALSVKSNFT